MTPRQETAKLKAQLAEARRLLSGIRDGLHPQSKATARRCAKHPWMVKPVEAWIPEIDKWLKEGKP